MPLRVTIRTDATATVQLARRMAALNRGPLLEAMGVHMETSVLNNFAAEGPRDPDPLLHPDIQAVPWAKNTVFTLALKGPRPVLMNTGILRASVNHFTNGRNAVSVGTNVRYAATHQYGYVFPKARTIPIPGAARGAVGKLLGGKRPGAIRLRAGTTIPRRPFVLFQRGDVAALSGIASRWVIEGVRL